jgi:hypothetical protein
VKIAVGYDPRGDGSAPAHEANGGSRLASRTRGPLMSRERLARLCLQLTELLGETLEQSTLPDAGIRRSSGDRPDAGEQQPV